MRKRPNSVLNRQLMTRNIVSTSLTTLLFTLGSIFSSPILAQNVDQNGDIDESMLEEVIVTGTHIAGLSEEQLPVTVMNAEAIEKLGAVSMSEVLSYIPSISDFEFEESNNGTNGARGDVAAVNMRGLGSGNTLVLLNGRRMVTHPTAQTSNSVPVVSYNVNSIASSGVRRVEVLRDGAAPLYGADAIAGVINFVPYTSYDSWRITGRYGSSEDTEYDETEITVAGGFKFNEERSDLGIFATFYDRSKVHISELGELYYNLDRRGSEELPEEWRNDSQLDNRSTRAPWAQFKVGALRDDGTFSGSTYHVDQDTGDIIKGSMPRSGRYNFNEDAWVTSAIERVNIMLTFNHEFDSGMEFFGDASYFQSESTIHRAASPIDDGLAFLIVSEDAYYNPFPDKEVLITRWRPTDLGPRIITVDMDTWRVLGGLRGDWGEWGWESALVASKATNTDTEENRQSKTLFIKQTQLQSEDALNPFVGPGGNSQAALDGIRIATVDVRESELNMWDFRVNRNALFQTFGNDVGLALGAEWRQEKYLDDRDSRVDGSMPFEDGDIFDESDVIGMSATFDSDGSRQTWSAYGELYMPLIGAANELAFTKALEVQLALRYEKPNDFSSTVKPKIGFRWEPLNGFSIRGSYTEGFRAPNLVQLNQGTIARRLQGINDPLREDVTESALDEGDTYRYTTRLGNPDLEPEDAETVLIGFVWSPEGVLSGLRMGVDWWNIKTQDAVGILDNDDQMDLDALLRSQGSFNPNVVRAAVTPEDQLAFDQWNAENPDDQREAVGAATNIITQYLNLDPREVEGYDAMIRYDTPEWAAGSFTFRGDMTKLTKFEQQGLATSNLLRRNGNPELRYTLGIDWQFRAFGTSLTMRYTDDFYDTSLYNTKTSDVTGTPDPVLNRVYWDVDSIKIYNLTLRYNFADLNGWASGLRMTGGIRNITKEDPPFADESFGYRRSIHRSYGRVFWFKLDYRFGG